MRILIYGAGVLGSRYAVGLQKAGQQVTILARGERYQQIRDGIVLEAVNTGELSMARVPVVEKLHAEDAYDLVVVLVRSNQVSEVLPALAANLYTPDVLFLGNNVHGAEEMIEALGRERVLMGFAAAAGVRDADMVRYLHSDKGSITYVGELDGQITPRLKRIQAAFAQSGFPVVFQRDILGWLRTHVAVISPAAYALYMCDGSNYRLARTRDAQVLLIRAIREGFNALKALGYPVVPASYLRMIHLPEPILVRLLQRLMDTKIAEIGMAGHANAARSEMEDLADGWWQLVQASGVPAPALQSLYLFRNPAQPPLAEESRQIPLKTREMWPVLGGLMLAAGLLGWAAGKIWKSPRRKTG
jgi:2-dehydropantoate 2-reductase